MTTTNTLHDEAQSTEAPSETPFFPNIATHDGKPLVHMGFHGWAAEVVVREAGRLCGYYVSRLSARPTWHYQCAFSSTAEAAEWLAR